MAITVCVFGASVTWGAWDKRLGGWVNRLRLAMDSEGTKVHVYNLGVSGATTANVLQCFEVESEARQPDVIIFQVGNNNLLDYGTPGQHAVSVENFMRNLAQLVEKARVYTNHILFLGIARYDERKTLPVSWRNIYYCNAAGEQYNQVIQATARQLGAGYLPLRDVLGNGDLSEGLHPNESGHQKIFEAVRAFMLKWGWLS